MPETTKRCYRCGQGQPLIDFIAKRNGQTYDMCSPCLHDILTNGGQRGKKERLRHTATARICYLCRHTKRNDGFTRRSNGTYFSACKACNINVFAHRRRARMLAAEGSFTTEEWLDLLAQHPVCPDCGRRWEDIPPPPNRTSVIDLLPEFRSTRSVRSASSSQRQRGTMRKSRLVPVRGSPLSRLTWKRVDKLGPDFQHERRVQCRRRRRRRDIAQIGGAGTAGRDIVGVPTSEPQLQITRSSPPEPPLFRPLPTGPYTPSEQPCGP